MFSLSRFLNPQSQKDSNETPRLAISEDGHIAYTNESFCTLAHISNSSDSLPVQKVIQFCEPDKSFANVSDGLHNVYVNGHNHVFSFHFDRLEIQNRGKYLIASQVEGNSPPSPSASRMASKAIMEKIASAYEPDQSSGFSRYVQPLQGNDLVQFSGMANDVMVVTSASGTILRVNEAFLQIFSTLTSNIPQMNFIDLFHETDKPYIRNTIQTCSLDHEDYEDIAVDFEARMQTKGDEPCYMEWRYHEAGDQIYCIGRDITPIKKHEQALSQREDQLSQAESIGRMGHWKWVLGQDKIDWSAEIYRIFGVQIESFTPSFHSMSEMVNRHDLDRVNQIFQRAMIEKNSYDMEFRVQGPDGDIRYIRCEGRCEIDEEGEVIALFGIMQDMTERILYERELREAKDRAERAYSAKSQFLANMSHELRTPLNAIIGFSEMMQQQLLGPIGNEQYIGYVEGIRESGNHLLDLISDILDMSKIEAGKYDLRYEEINLHKILQLALHMMEHKAADQGVTLTIQTEITNDLTIIADRRAVLQILLNILSNAVKFSHKGRQVQIDCHAREGYVSLKIRDEGIGIPANKLPTITRPFEQVSSHYTREHEGSGLGLAITKELVELHRGILSIESTVGVGTTVTVRLPYDASPQKAEPSKEETV